MAPSLRPAAAENDEALVAELALGDERALRALHSRYTPLVFSIAARVVGEAAAEEVVQDVFLTLWQKHASFDPQRGSFKSWLAQIARRRALNELRRRRGRTDETETEDALDELGDEALQPDEALWKAHRTAVIRKAVDALPPPQKQALSLAFFDELTHEQVASAIHAPVGTTKTRIRLAMKRLAPALMALVAVVALALAWSEEHERATQARALRLVTASDVVAVRLTPAADVPAAAHGWYRAKRGVPTAVLTTSHLPSLGAGERYVGWARHGERWLELGVVDVKDDERSVLVLEDPRLASPADEVRVTRESNIGSAPRGSLVLGWTAPR